MPSSSALGSSRFALFWSGPVWSGLFLSGQVLSGLACGCFTLKSPFGGIPPPHFLFCGLFSNGGYWASSWRVLGEFSASSWRILEKASKMEPDCSQRCLKSIKNEDSFWLVFREASESANPNIFPPIWAPFWLCF